MSTETRPRIVAARRFEEGRVQWRAQHWVKTSIHGPYPHGAYVDVRGGNSHGTPERAIHEASDLI